MKKVLIISSVILVSACGGTGQTQLSDAIYLCGHQQGHRAGRVQVNGIWTQCSYQNGAPTLSSDDLGDSQRNEYDALQLSDSILN